MFDYNGLAVSCLEKKLYNMGEMFIRGENRIIWQKNLSSVTIKVYRRTGHEGPDGE